LKKGRLYRHCDSSFECGNHAAVIANKHSLG
jgi:hypothetical protein